MWKGIQNHQKCNQLLHHSPASHPPLLGSIVCPILSPLRVAGRSLGHRPKPPSFSFSNTSPMTDPSVDSSRQFFLRPAFSSMWHICVEENSSHNISLKPLSKHIFCSRQSSFSERRTYFLYYAIFYFTKYLPTQACHISFSIFSFPCAFHFRVHFFLSRSLCLGFLAKIILLFRSFSGIFPRKPWGCQLSIFNLSPQSWTRTQLFESAPPPAILT